MIVSKETLQLWQTQAELLARAKAQEMATRKIITTAILGGPNVAGTKHATLGYIEATASASETLKVTRDDVLPLVDELTEEEKACIVWKPSIIKKNYDKLPEDNNLKEIVSMTIGAPTLKIVDLEEK